MVNVVVLNLRAGVRDRILTVPSVGDINVSVWGGGMFEGVQEVMEGRLSLLELDFAGTVRSFNPWNTIVGGRIEIGRHIDLMVDVGIGQRRSLMLSATFRF
jgi:hypothetical protein